MPQTKKPQTPPAPANGASTVPQSVDTKAPKEEELLRKLKLAFAKALRAKLAKQHGITGIPTDEEAIKSNRFNIISSGAQGIGCQIDFDKEAGNATFTPLALDQASIEIFHKTIAAYQEAYKQEFKEDLVFELTANDQAEAMQLMAALLPNIKISKLSYFGSGPVSSEELQEMHKVIAEQKTVSSGNTTSTPAVQAKGKPIIPNFDAQRRHSQAKSQATTKPSAKQPLRTSPRHKAKA